MVNNIIFDFDGTIFDTIEGITKCVRYALNKIGLDAELSSLRMFAGPPLGDMFMSVFGLNEQQAQQAVRDFRERYVPIGVYESQVFPGIPELLQKLKSAGYNTGIATSKPQHLAQHLLERAGIADMFDAITGSTPDGKDDSKELVLRKTMDKLSASRENTVLVGDTKWDVYGAAKCGVPCIGVAYGYAAEGELEKAGACAVVENEAELYEYILKL